ncbi:DUF305 domain-containing protein [Streptomyces sp. NPDC001858]
MRTTRTLTRRAVLAAAAVTAAFTLAACGNDDGSDSKAAGGHNEQDVSFAQGMIPHHRQALGMARLAAGRASSAEVEDLAARVEKAQDPEITTMSGWLTSWGEDVPATSGMNHSGDSGSSGAHGMPGMMDGSDMAELAKASGTDFDSLFLTLMVEHHEGAVDMAEAEKDKGEYGPATSLADDIVTAQSAEIAEMNKLLGKSGESGTS